MLKSKNLEINNNNGVTFITFPKLRKTKVVNHAFTTRIGGVSKGYFGAMNMSITGGDEKQDVLENYKIICNAAGIDYSHLVLSHQTHTNNILTVTENDIGKGIFRERDYENIDGLITNCRGVALVTQYADCTPLLFCDPVKKVIATSHAGWRGSAAEIGIKTVKRMQEEFGCNPKDIIAAIGPSICADCYEVDTPLYNAFETLESVDVNSIFKSVDETHFKLDLWEANRQMLIYAGIKEENIDVTDLCTCCNSKYLHSHRFTGGKRGTLAAIIELK